MTSIQGKEVDGNWPGSQVMGGQVILATHRWGPAERDQWLGSPFLPAQLVPTVDAQQCWRGSNFTGSLEERQQPCLTPPKSGDTEMGPARWNASEKTFLGFYQPWWPERPGGHYFRLKFSKSRKASQANQQWGCRPRWKGPQGLPFSAWLSRLQLMEASRACFHSP